MDPLRLHMLLIAATEYCDLSTTLAARVYRAAGVQLQERWPLAGCVVQYDRPTPTIITVGRQ